MITRAWLIVLAASSSACEARDADRDPCFECREEGTDRVCFENKGCVDTCDAGCEDGHPCVLYEGENVCSLTCVPESCDTHEDCVYERGDCHYVSCSARVPCDDPAAVCDEYQRSCFPETGECEDAADCPVFDPALDAFAKRECTQRRCQLLPVSPRAPSADDVPLLVTALPADGEVFDLDTDIRFEWTPTGTTVIALVLDSIADAPDELMEKAIWGAVLSRTEGATVTWSEGTKVVDGEFTLQSASVPQHVPLYFVMQAVRGETMVGISSFVRFGMSDEGLWPEEGDSCEEEGAVGGACDRPGWVMACVDARCRAVCLSQRDCDANGVCDRVRSGLRVCR